LFGTRSYWRLLSIQTWWSAARAVPETKINTPITTNSARNRITIFRTAMT
jgi:hypothetical protein